MAFLMKLTIASLMAISFLSAQEEMQVMEQIDYSGVVPVGTSHCPWEWAYFQDLTIEPPADRYTGCGLILFSEECYQSKWNSGSLNDRIIQQLYLAYVAHRLGNTKQACEVFELIDQMIEHSLTNRLIIK